MTTFLPFRRLSPTGTAPRAYHASHLIEPHGGTLVDLLVDARARRRAQGRLPRLAVLGPDAAPALRPRAAAERRLLAADRLHGQGGLRVRLRAACAWPTARSGRSRSCSTSRASWPTSSRAGTSVAGPARPRGRDAGRAPRRGGLGARPRGEAQATFGTLDRKHPGVAHLLRPDPPGGARRPARGAPAADPLRLPRAAPHAGRAARRVRARWAGARSSPSRPATPCTAPTTS